MKIRTLLGFAGGFVASYAACRLVDSVYELRAPLPVQTKDAAIYGRRQRANAVAGIVRGLSSAALVAYGPGERFGAALVGLPVWARPAAFATAVLLAEDALETPVAFVEGVVTERRYGLTERSNAAWGVEQLKGAGVGAAFTAVIAALFGFAVRGAPRWWPLIASVGVLPLFVLGNVLVPLYILPMFNKFEPLTGSLEQRLRALASRFDVGNAEILGMDMSRQTSKANAFVTGIFNTHRIVIGDTLLENFEEDEVEFVVAHELGHYVSKDTWRLILVGQGLASLLFLFAYLMVGKRDREALRDNPVLLARLYFWMLVGSQILRPALFAFSRSREWAADHFAVATTKAPRTGASAFRRLRDQNLAEDEQPAWYEFMFGSHPSLKARIAELEFTDAEVTPMKGDSSERSEFEWRTS
jgi:STE24 endopeptidase